MKNTRKKITIVQSAIKYKNKIYTGYRHALIIEKMWQEEKIGINDIKQRSQGFITSDGRFVDRIEAANIAFKAGQIGSGINSLDSYHIFL